MDKEQDYPARNVGIRAYGGVPRAVVTTDIIETTSIDNSHGATLQAFNEWTDSEITQLKGQLTNIGSRVSTKAEQSDLDATNATVATKASQTDLDALISRLTALETRVSNTDCYKCNQVELE